MTKCNAPIYHLNVIDSSNNYAMHLINANTAHDGTLIMAGAQTAGRGQRGKQWLAQQNQALLMSLIWLPSKDLSLTAFEISSAVALAVVSALLENYPSLNCRIKWPNDIFIGDKKTAGILIENSYHAQQLQHSIIGIGMNMNQEKFEDILGNATSLKIAGAEPVIEKTLLAKRIRYYFYQNLNNSHLQQQYQEWLYARDVPRNFLIDNQVQEAIVTHVDHEGRLVLQINGTTRAFHHGQLEWIW